MECVNCGGSLIEVTTCVDSQRNYLCANCGNNGYVATWGTKPVWPIQDKIEVVDSYIFRTQLAVNVKTHDKKCAYCHTNWHEDSRGNCSSCGAGG